MQVVGVCVGAEERPGEPAVVLAASGNSVMNSGVLAGFTATLVSIVARSAGGDRLLRSCLPWS